MFEVLASFLLLMLAGCLWNLIPNVPPKAIARSSISAVVIYFFLPALAFQVLYTAPLNTEMLKIPVISAWVCLGTAAVAYALYGLLDTWLDFCLNRRALGAMLLAAGWSNATYLGLPTVTATFGEEYRRIPILFDILALTPLLLTVGASIGIHFGKTTGPRTSFGRGLRDGLRAVLKLPPFWAAVLGLAFNAFGLHLPPLITRTFQTAGSAVAPLMIFFVGLALQKPALRTLLWILPAVMLKLGFAPLLASIGGRFLGLEGVARGATILEAAMPTMVLTLVIADRFELDTELLAQAIALSTLLSFLTMPATLHLFGY